jgi:L-fuconolactonase
MIDAHQHFWRIDRGDYGWMSPDLTALYRDFGPQDLAPLLARAGVGRSIVVQAAETEAETDFLLGIAATTPWVAGVVGWLNMQDAGFATRLDHYCQQPGWVGLRPMLQDHPPADILTPVFRHNLARVAHLAVPFDILTFPRHLPALIEVLDATPGLHAVVDHLSKPDMVAGSFDHWSAQMARIAAHDGICCKVSGLITEAGPDWTPGRIRPFVQRAADLFGPQRLMFGSDWPVCTLAGGYGDVMALSRTLLSECFGPEEMAAIFGGNATRFYRI